MSILTPEDVAARLRIPAREVVGLVRAGVLEGLEITPRVWRVLPDSVERARSRFAVYLVADPLAGAVKIGYSASVGRRLQELSAAGPHRLRLLATAWFATERAARAFEKGMHRKFRRLRLRGEWFRDDPTIEDAIRSGGVR